MSMVGNPEFSSFPTPGGAAAARDANARPRRAWMGALLVAALAAAASPAWAQDNKLTVPTMPDEAADPATDTPPVGALDASELTAPDEVAARKNPEKAAKDAAFKAAVDGVLPMSPEQIQQLLDRLESSQRAAAPPPGPAPRAEVKVTTLSLDPGVEPPTIQVSAGFVTTLTMLDATGQPWPIIDVGIGGSFDVPQPEQGSHVVRIAPLTRFGTGNLSIRLVDLPTPIAFKLSSGGDVVHYRYDARVPQFGPGAKMPLIDKGSNMVAGDAVIMAVLDGVPPNGAQRLNVSGVDSRTAAWKIGERIFVRTPFALLSPGWDSSVSSADGMTVYTVANAPVLLLSDNGMLVRARVSQRESADE